MEPSGWGDTDAQPAPSGWGDDDAGATGAAAVPRGNAGGQPDRPAPPTSGWGDDAAAAGGDDPDPSAGGWGNAGAGGGEGGAAAARSATPPGQRSRRQPWGPLAAAAANAKPAVAEGLLGPTPAAANPARRGVQQRKNLSAEKRDKLYAQLVEMGASYVVLFLFFRGARLPGCLTLVRGGGGGGGHGHVMLALSHVFVCRARDFRQRVVLGVIFVIMVCLAFQMYPRFATHIFDRVELVVYFA